MNGDLDTAAGRGDLVRLALRLIVEEALEGEVADVFLDNARYHHAKIVQSGYRNPDEGSRCFSSRRTARISNPSSGCGR